MSELYNIIAAHFRQRGASTTEVQHKGEKPHIMLRWPNQVITIRITGTEILLVKCHVDGPLSEEMQQTGHGFFGDPNIDHTTTKAKTRDLSTPGFNPIHWIACNRRK